MKENGGTYMFDDRMVTWKVVLLLPVLFLGEAVYCLCDLTIKFHAMVAHHWTLPAQRQSTPGPEWPCLLALCPADMCVDPHSRP